MLDALAPGRRRTVASCRARCSASTAQPAWISRSGYTGEDGFEISVAARRCRRGRRCAHRATSAVKPIGLGARDSLRLEAGLPLYGHDLDRETTPVMAGLEFAIGKRRRAEGGFAGAAPDPRRDRQWPGPEARRPAVDGRQPVREGALILDGEGNEVGRITSGGLLADAAAADRDGLCRHRAWPSPAPRSSSSSAASCSRRRSRRCRSSPTAITAKQGA